MAAAKFNKKDSKLIEDLLTLSKKSPKLVRSSLYEAPADPSIHVRSWKMNEFKYYDIPSPFPTLARGLFTLDLEDGDHRIVARGYDKFFNIGEVPWTTWSSIEAHTAAPYTLTLKSNGCIIFIAALTETQLIVTSKHSLGHIQGNELSHAEAGEQWLRKYLDKKGRTEEELAQVLWKHNWTVVSELCDDNFEEHVLAYPPERTGLHLHGINVSTKVFNTLPQDTVDAFAEEWGFIKTKSIVLDTIQDVQKFTDEVAERGEWEGEAVEGFVVRTHVTQPPHETKRGTQLPISASPYDPGTSFFFKIKFDEPYMMYRDWREMTKKLLSGGVALKASKLPNNKMRRPETKVYVRWVIDEIKRDKEAFEEYNKGKGIIATRERFLEYLKTPEGQAELESVRTGKTVQAESMGGKTVIVPVAIPGCGKTTVAVALAHIFGFGHTQSDDIKSKKPAPVFLKNVSELLNQYDVVIADKNNHLRQHRTALRDLRKDLRLVALYWNTHGNQAMVHRICSGRIDVRGENHQSLRADAEHKSHEDVIWKFLRDSEDLGDAEVDDVIEINVEDGLEAAVNHTVHEIASILGLPSPPEPKIKEGLEHALAYKAKVDQHKGEQTTPKKKEKEFRPRYFGLLPELDIEEAIERHLTEAKGVPGPCKQFWKAVKGTTPRHHVTITHGASLSTEEEVWDRCMGLHKATDPPLFSFKLGHLVWNERVMALTVEDLKVEKADEEQRGAELVSTLPHEIRERLHITVGTRHGAKPVEAKDMVEEWKRHGDKGHTQSIDMGGIQVQGVVKGLH